MACRGSMDRCGPASQPNVDCVERNNRQAILIWMMATRLTTGTLMVKRTQAVSAIGIRQGPESFREPRKRYVGARALAVIAALDHGAVRPAFSGGT